MRKFILIAALALIYAMQPLSAQRLSYAYLLGSDSVNVVLDYSLLQFETADRDGFQQALAESGDQWFKLFIDEMNSSNDSYNLHFGHYPNARYTVSVLFTQVTASGAMKAVFRTIDMQNVSEVSSTIVSCRGGLHGPFFEIFGESVERIGEKVGDLIKDNIL